MQMVSSALVATQVDAGSAAGVPDLLAQLRNATDQGQLQVSLAHITGRKFCFVLAGKTVHGGHPYACQTLLARMLVPIADFLPFSSDCCNRA